MKCSTVNICDGNGSYIVINESDFDKKEHKLFGAKPEKKSKGKGKGKGKKGE